MNQETGQRNGSGDRKSRPQPASDEQKQRRLNPVVYAGEHPVKAHQLVVLGRQDIAPRRLFPALEKADYLVLLEAFSFPFEILQDVHWSIPLVVCFPDSHDVNTLLSRFSGRLFYKLTFFDKIVCGDDLWTKLQRIYGWSEHQRIKPDNKNLNRILSDILAVIRKEEETNYELLQDEYQPASYWQERGNILAPSGSHRAVCRIKSSLRNNKAIHRAQAHVLTSEFSRILGTSESSLNSRVLEVGCGIGRWCMWFASNSISYTGVDISHSMIETAKSNFSSYDFHEIKEDLLFPFEDNSFDISFTVTVLHHNPLENRQRLLSEMFRVTRSGGHLVFLEDLVSPERTKKSNMYPLQVSALMDSVWETSNGQVVLSYVETIRYNLDDQTRSGLLSFQKIAVGAE